MLTTESPSELNAIKNLTKCGRRKSTPCDRSRERHGDRNDLRSGSTRAMINRRQIRAARLIVATLLLAACASDTPIATLPRLMARADFAQWRTIAFTAGVPVPDEGVKRSTIALLEGML